MLGRSKEAHRAQLMVREAVRKGTIKKPDACESCGVKKEPRLLAGHHYKGYKFPLKVIFVCSKCHAIMDTGIGEKHGNAKLNRKIVDELRRLHRAGLHYLTLSWIFDVNPCTVENVVYNRYWRHV